MNGDFAQCFWRGWKAQTHLESATLALNRIASIHDIAKIPDESMAGRQIEIYLATARLAISHAIEELTTGRRTVGEDSCVKLTERDFEPLKEKFESALRLRNISQARDIIIDVSNKVYDSAKEAGALV